MTGALAGHRSPPDRAVDLYEAARSLLERVEAGGRDPASMSRLWPVLGEQGWFRVLVTPELDGLGLGPVELGQLLLALGERPVVDPISDHAVAVALLAEHPDVPADIWSALDGRTRIVLVDPAVHINVRRRPVLRLAKGRLVGQADAVAGAGAADRLLIIASNQADGQECICLVDTADDGVAVAPYPGVTSLPEPARVDVDIDVEPLLSGAAAGHLLDRMRTLMAFAIGSELAGLARGAAELAVEYARVREQFGRPIGTFQAIQHMLADASVDVTALRNLTLRTAEDISVNPTDWFAAAALKSAAALRAQRTVETALQVHGGVGFTRDHPLHIYIERALALVGRYGDSRELDVSLGRALIEGDRAPSPWTARSRTKHGIRLDA